jgi:membrane fusion protein (multidrug efflux system)
MNAPIREPIALVPVPTREVMGESDTKVENGRGTRSRIRLLLMIGGVAVVAIGAAYFWYTGGRYASTDDAYVRAAEVSVSTDVSGIVTEVDVKESQPVKAGDVLFRIDPLQYQNAVNNAQATLAETGLNIDALKVNYQEALRNIAAQQAVVANDQLTFDRFSGLVKDNLAITRATFDQARLTLESDKQKLGSLQEQAQSQLAQLMGNPDIATDQHPQYLQAKAQVEEAQRQLDHTIVRAPFTGIVTRVDNLQPGVFLVAQTAGLTNQGAVALVSTDDVWVDAEMKETDLTYVKSGDPVEIQVDTYPSVTWSGSVDSVSPAGASDFSILPPQNGSGNWVKVVQRIPTRIKVDRQPGQPVLRSGMSVEVSIDTGHRRKLSDLF